MTTAFVTGATGFVGLNLVEQLVAAGWDVTALHRPSSDLTRLRRFPVRLVEGDLGDPDALERAVPPEVGAVFHVAGNTSMWRRAAARQTRDNVTGTANMVAAALAARARRFVFTSSWNAWGWVLGAEALSEEMPQRGRDSWIPYDRSKALAEEEVRKGMARGLAAVILNPAHIVGRYDAHNWARMIRLVHQRRLPGVPPGAGTFCHAEQVALAHIAAAGRGRVGENYLLGGADATFLEMVRIIGELAGRKVPQRALPAPLVKALARIYAVRGALAGREPDLTPESAALVTARVRVASRKAETELGYQAVPLRRMLEDSYRWLGQEGLLEADSG